MFFVVLLLYMLLPLYGVIKVFVSVDFFRKLVWVVFFPSVLVPPCYLLSSLTPSTSRPPFPPLLFFPPLKSAIAHLGNNCRRQTDKQTNKQTNVLPFLTHELLLTFITTVWTPVVIAKVNII